MMRGYYEKGKVFNPAVIKHRCSAYIKRYNDRPSPFLCYVLSESTDMISLDCPGKQMSLVSWHPGSNPWRYVCNT